MEGQIQQVTCPVCMGIFRRPATLPCGHTFCFSCILNATRQHRNCPVCRQNITFTPNKLRPDHTIAIFIESLRKAQKKNETKYKPENIHIECKEERLLLVDILTDDLLLPFNRIVATFQLQSSMLIDRMERFVARQQLPYNKYAIVCRLVHIEKMRRNLYRAVIEGRGFCKIESQGVESEVSLQADEQEFFYRTCRCKEISEASDSNPAEYSSFFSYFGRLSNELKTQVYQRIDPTVFNSKNDPIAIFYSILGIVSMTNEDKYNLAISFDEERRISQVKKFIANNQKKIQRNPAQMVRVPSSTSGGPDKRVYLVLMVLMFLLWMSRQNYLEV